MLEEPESKDKSSCLRKGGLVFIKTKVHTALFSPFSVFPFITEYVVYGFRETEDIFAAERFASNKFVKVINDRGLYPLRGIVVEVCDLSKVNPEENLGIAYKILIENKLSPLWFLAEDVSPLTEETIHEAEKNLL